MEFKKAREIHNKKKYGKCLDCEHRKYETKYCCVRQENMLNDILGDLFKIKFCKYYEPIIKCPCGEQGEEGIRG